MQRDLANGPNRLRCHDIGKAVGQGRGNACRDRKRIASMRHRRCAGVVLLTLDRDLHLPQTHDPRDHANRLTRQIQNRALLDMHFQKGAEPRGVDEITHPCTKLRARRGKGQTIAGHQPIGGLQWQLA